MEHDPSIEDISLRHVEKINALIDYIRQAGFKALNEYQQDKMLNLTVRQVMLIATVHRLTREGNCGGVTLSNLARELRMSVSAASHLIDTLENHNLLMRGADEEDRRSIRITLSHHGKKCAMVAKRGMLDAINSLTSHLTPEENALRLSMIERLYHVAYPETR